MNSKETDTRWLIIRNGAVGDTVLLSPVVQCIRNALPDAWIEVIGNQERVELLVGSGMVDQATSFEQPGMEALFVDEGKLNKVLKSYFSGFDLILYFGNGDANALMAKLKQREEQTVVVHPALPDGEETHITMHYWNALDGIIEHAQSFIPKIVLSDEEKAWGKEWIASLCEHADQTQFIGLHVGAGSKEKMAPFDHFIEVISPSSDSSKNNRVFLIPKGPADKKAVSDFLDRFGKKMQILLVENLRLRELASVLIHCDWFLGNDSGITHIAAALGIPTTVLFVRSNPKVWTPLGKHVKVEIV